MIWIWILYAIVYISFIIFVVGVIYRVVNWAKSAVPLKIPTVAGQAKSFSFIKRTIKDRIDSPFSRWEVILRMFFEVFLFRSLFRNTRYYIDKQENRDTRFLWFFAIAFHYMLLIIVLRHLRLFTNPVPEPIKLIDYIDSFFGAAIVPPLYISSVIALICLAFLWGRRILLAKERSLSLPSDHFALALMATILITGMLMRYVIRVDVSSVKELALGLVTFHPPSQEVIQSINPVFYIHLLCVCFLIAYIPFSKLMHFAGIFFSSTRNMPNDNRYRRHINPWDPNPETPILARVGITVNGLVFKCKKLDWDTYYEMYKDQLDEIAESNYVIKPEEL